MFSLKKIEYDFDFPFLFQAYVNVYQGDELPEPKSMLIVRSSQNLYV